MYENSSIHADDNFPSSRPIPSYAWGAVKGVDHETTIDKIRYNQHVHERKKHPGINNEEYHHITPFHQLDCLRVGYPRITRRRWCSTFQLRSPKLRAQRDPRASKFSTSENNEENDLWLSNAAIMLRILMLSRIDWTSSLRRLQVHALTVNSLSRKDSCTITPFVKWEV